MPMMTLYYAILFMSVRTTQMMIDTNGLNIFFFKMKIDIKQESEID